MIYVYPFTIVEYNNEFNEETNDEIFTFDDFEIDEKEKNNKTQLPSVDIVYFKALVIKKMLKNEESVVFQLNSS
jgi:hypothetical protein